MLAAPDPCPRHRSRAGRARGRARLRAPLDRSRPTGGARRAALAGSSPGFRSPTRRRSAPDGDRRRPSTVDFATGIRPWLGKEAAFALLDTPAPRAPSLIVLDVATAPAQPFLRAPARRPSASTTGSILGYRTGTELAFVKHYLVVGPDASRTRRDRRRNRTCRHSPGPRLSAGGRGRARRPRVRCVSRPPACAGAEPRGGMIGAIAGLLAQPAPWARRCRSPASGRRGRAGPQRASAGAALATRRGRAVARSRSRRRSSRCCRRARR